MAIPNPPISADDSSTPFAAWQNILSAASAGPDTDCVAVAMDLAEATLHAALRHDNALPSTTPALRQVVRSGAVFSRIALLWHQVLTDTDAFTRSRASTAARCLFDPDTIRTWLTNPPSTSTDASSHMGGDGVTVADALQLGIDFDIYGFDKWEKINSLVAQAQHDRLFGIPDHTIGVLHLAGERGYVNQHRVTLTTPMHATLCSGDLDTMDLIGDGYGVDAAVHILQQVAHATDRLLHERALLADVAWPAPVHDHPHLPTATPATGRAFRPLAGVDPQPPVTASPALAVPATRGQPHR